MKDTPLKSARLKADLTQDQLAGLANTSQPQIRRLEAGERKLTKQWAERLAPHLNVTPQSLVFDALYVEITTGMKVADAQITEEPQFLGARDFKVFASAECGPGEIQVFSTEPYEIVQRPWYAEKDPKAFAVVLTGDSMEPIWEAGEIVVVSPKAPLVKGKEAIFIGGEENGDFKASLKRYKGQTSAHWLVKQFNPERDIELDKRIWTKAIRVIGSFDG